MRSRLPNMKEHNTFWKRTRGIYRFLIVVCSLALILAIILFYFNTEHSKVGMDQEDPYVTLPVQDIDRIENGIHVRTGLKEGVGMMETIQNCTACHSAKLIMQNRMDKERWTASIRWMQKTQNLWDLGANEDIIINYLVANYPPGKKGRREALTDIEWYDLKE